GHCSTGCARPSAKCRRRRCSTWRPRASRTTRSLRPTYSTAWSTRRTNRLQVELFLVILPDSALVNRPDRNVVRVFRGLYPKPSLLDLCGMEVMRFGREQHRAPDKCGDNILPLAGAHQGHARDMVGILMQEAKLFPASREVNAVHFRNVSKNSQRAFLPLLNGELKLRFKRLNVFRRHLACDFESKRPTAALFQTLDHG